MAFTHWILQGKGGVGKSMIAATLVQYLAHKGKNVACIDMDPMNHTLAGYKEFEAVVFNIMDGDAVDPRKFDGMMELLFNAAPDQHIVIDNGASNFIALLGYIKENDGFTLLQEQGHKVLLHTLVTGGQAMQDTLTGVKSLCKNFPEMPVTVWLNLYYGEIKDEDTGKPFEQFQTYQEVGFQFQAVVRLPNFNKNTYGRDIEAMLAKKQGFNTAINSSLPIMVRQRLKTYWRAMCEAIDQAGLVLTQEDGQRLTAGGN
jgi:hypothetical protein